MIRKYKNKNIKFLQTLLMIILIIISICFLGYFIRNLNPLNNKVLIFHDMTIFPRISQYTLNILNGKIPPRMAPDMYQRMSYPVFNFYAPGVYIISFLFNILGINLVNTVKLLFALSVIAGYVSFYLFAKRYFENIVSIIGAGLYSSCLYIATNIFVRGNLGEAWFIGLLPLVFYAIDKIASYQLKNIPKNDILLTTFIISFVLLLHNLLSIIFIPILLFYVSLQNNKKQLYLILAVAIMIDSFFFLPLIFENKLVYATEIAKMTKYSDHFLCPQQIWQSQWGFAGSTKGCIDGMSFMIGKIQLLLFIQGLVFFLVTNLWKFKKNTNKRIYLFFIILTFGSLFMTLSFSNILWQNISILQTIQFPWRFLCLAIIGISFFGAYLIDNIPKKFHLIALFLIFGLLFIYNGKYFYGKYITQKHFANRYQDNYTKFGAVFNIPEYIPKTANFDYIKQSWDIKIKGLVNSAGNYLVVTNKKYQKNFYAKSDSQYFLNILYFPYWQIKINGRIIIPDKFDPLGRPVLNLKNGDYVEAIYRQTRIEKLGNLLTFFSLILILFYIMPKNRLLNLINQLAINKQKPII